MKNEFEHIDELFRQKFENFEPEPPHSVWENVKNALNNISGGAGFRTFMFSTFGFLFLGVALVFLTRPFDKSNTIASESKSSDFRKQIAYKPELNHNSQSHSYQTEANNAGKNKPATIQIPETTLNISEEVSQQKLSQQSPQQNTNRKKIRKQQSLEKLNIKQAEIAHDQTRNIESHKEITEWQLDNEWYGPAKRPGLWKLGLSLNPEITLYPSDTINNSRNYNFDFSVAYHMPNNFFLQSGLGIALAKDEGRYKIDYESYDVIGSYNDLLNITFDSTGQGVIPVYETEKVDVYDSIRHLKISKSTNTYTYLQIPLLIGYQKDYKRLGFYVKAGPNLSLLINKHIPGAELPDDVTVIDMDARIANRINTNWQLLMGAGVNYHLNNKWEVAVEPTFRYYLNSAYDTRHVSTKHPFAFGLRAGIYLKLK